MRIRLLVEVDLDPIPGAMHSPESAQRIVENALKNVIPHYNPTAQLMD